MSIQLCCVNVVENRLYDCILSYQCEKSLKNINFQLWELRQSKKDMSWLLTCRKDSNLKPLIS